MQFYLLIFIFLLTPFYALGTESNKFTIDGNKVIFESIGDEIGIDYGDAEDDDEGDEDEFRSHSSSSLRF